MTYAEAQEYLFALRTIGSKFGLERMRALYDALGQPCAGIPVIHVAGTNGKGSVCAMAEAVLRANGCKTGMFTSPHLLRLGERVQVNRVPLAETQIVAYVAELAPVAERIAAGDRQNHPTFFELMTVMALLHFEREGCDVAIIETGLGGRLDSTNVLLPAVTAITSIGLDHQEFLGDTLEAIAAEKAGIIKQGVPLVLGHVPPAAEAVILRRAREVSAPVTHVGDVFSLRAAAVPMADAGGAAAAECSGNALGTTESCGCRQAVSPAAAAEIPAVAAQRDYPQTSLSGDFQRANAGVALLACEILCAKVPKFAAAGGRAIAIDREKSLAALQQVEWAGRWQRIVLADGRELILDASHNEEGSRALEANLLALRARLGGQRPVVVTGVLGAARAQALLGVIARNAAAVALVPVQQPRACDVEQLRACMPGDFNGKIVCTDVEKLFPGGLRIEPTVGGLCEAASLCPVVVTGSIYLIGEIMSRLYETAADEAVLLQDKIL